MCTILNEINCNYDLLDVQKKKFSTKLNFNSIINYQKLFSTFGSCSCSTASFLFLISGITINASKR